MLGQTKTMTNISTPYKPVALYLEDSDSLEYVRIDCACVHKRVDALLTLVLDMKERKLIGFRLKGFKNFYIKSLRDKQSILMSDFLIATSVLEKAMEVAANKFFDDYNVDAYRDAWKIAADDKVELRDLPRAA